MRAWYPVMAMPGLVQGLVCLALAISPAAVGAAGKAGDCTATDAKLLSTLLDSPFVLEALNRALLGQLPRSLGDCSSNVAQNTEVQPCRTVAGFPLQRGTSMVTWRADLVTHVDTLRISNLSARCDVTNKTDSTRRMFLQLNGGFRELALATHMSVKFPPVELDAPCVEGQPCLLDRNDVLLAVAARMGCVGEDALGLQIDPEYGIQLGNFDFESHGFKADITGTLAKIIALLLDQVRIPCVAVDPTLTFCRVVCGGSQAVEEVAGQSLQSQAHQALGSLLV